MEDKNGCSFGSDYKCPYSKGCSGVRYHIVWYDFLPPVDPSRLWKFMESNLTESSKVWICDEAERFLLYLCQLAVKCETFNNLEKKAKGIEGKLVK